MTGSEFEPINHVYTYPYRRRKVLRAVGAAAHALAALVWPVRAEERVQKRKAPQQARRMLVAAVL